MDAVEQAPVPFIAKGVNVGADIGQRVDPTAIVVAERQLRGYQESRYTESELRQLGRGGDGITGGTIHYAIRFIERLPLGTSYPKAADRIAEVVRNLSSAAIRNIEPRLQQAYGSTIPGKSVHQVLIDATGVGTPVVDLLEERRVEPLTAVYLTGGEKATREHGELRLAKSLLVSRLQVLLQERRIHLPNTQQARDLTEELLNYDIRITETANLQMGVFKTGKHDDLATALGLACWETDTAISVGMQPTWMRDYRG